MPPLSESLCPQLSPEIIKQCKDVGIQTVTAFISSNIEELAKKTNVSYKDFAIIRQQLLSKFAGFPQRADSLYKTLVESLCILSTGSLKVDRFLKGGIYAGEVTEIFGRPGSGKTQFAMTVSACLLAQSNYTVLYLDSNNNFSARRLQQILSKKIDNQKVLKDKLSCINIVNIQDICHLLTLFESLKTELAKKKNKFFDQLKLIIVDSVTNLLSQCFGGNYLDGYCFMSNIERFFKFFCSQHMVSILVCNNTVQVSSLDIKAALGPNWKYIPSVILCIKPTTGSFLRKLTVVKSCRHGLGHESNFVINEAGISD